MNQRKPILIAKRLGVGCIGVLCLVLSVPVDGFAQGGSDNAQISGFVKDPTGAVVPAVKVVVKNQNTTFERSAPTNQEGYYVISSLPPGFYTLTAEHAGFKRFQITNKKLDPSIATNVDINLEVGQATETVEVTASMSSVQTETATLGRLVERTQIELTELNGRNPLMLALLKPGVTGGTGAAGGGLLAGNSFGLTTGGFNINGSRGQANLITFDGAVGVRTRSNATFSIGTADLDAVQEVQILTANYNAEYGRSSGGQIRIVSKSGSQDLHGVLYEYLRNSALNANSWARKANPTSNSCDQSPADQQCRANPFRYNQFGYNLSGPVLLPFTHYNRDRSKLFWSWSQEWVHQRDSTLRTLLVPSLAMRNGDFSELLGPNRYFNTTKIVRNPNQCTDPSNINTCAPFSGNIITQGLSQNGLAILRAFPAPIPGFTGPNNANWFAARPNQVNQLKNTIAIDFNPTNKHHIRWRAQIFRQISITAFPFTTDPGYTPRTFDLPNRWSTVNWVWTVSPTWVNEALIGGSHDRVDISIDTTNAARSRYGINYAYLFPAGKEIPDKIPSVEGLSARLDGSPYPAKSAGPIYQLSDHVTNIRGNHTLKFGGYFERSGENDFDQINVAGIPGGTNNQNGAFRFSDTTRFSDGTRGGTGLALANAAIGLFDTYAELGRRSYTPYRGHMFEWFIQDSWKATERLRVEAGLRHSIIQPHYSLWGNIVVFDPQFYNRAIAVTQDPRTGFITGGTLQGQYNGLVIPGSGWPDAAKQPGRVSIANTGQFDFLFRGVPKQYSEIHKNNLAPRIGIAYAFNNKNVIRVGVGRFFDRLGVSDSVLLGGNPPLQPTVSVSGGSVDNPGGTGGTAFPLTVTSQDRIFPNPEAWTWNATYQREIGFSTTAEVSYVGRKGLHLQRERNINQLQPGTVNAGGTNPGANPDPLRPFKGFATIRVTNNEASSFYNSFQLGVTRRFTHGFSFGIAYTLSKSSDDGSAQRDIVPNAFDVSHLWGPSDFDRHHVLVINAIYELPFFKDRSSLRGKVLGGWTINAVSQFQTGTPFSVNGRTDDYAGVGPGSGSQYWIVNGDPTVVGKFSTSSSDQNFWFQIKNPDGSNIFTRPAPGTFSTQNVRNLIYNPGAQNHNLGLFKNFTITERQRLQFRFEAFNWVNHPNWNAAINDPKSANFGKVNSKSSERQLQIALRYSF